MYGYHKNLFVKLGTKTQKIDANFKSILLKEEYQETWLR